MHGLTHQCQPKASTTRTLLGSWHNHINLSLWIQAGGPHCHSPGCPCRARLCPQICHSAAS